MCRDRLGKRNALRFFVSLVVVSAMCLGFLLQSVRVAKAWPRETVINCTVVSARMQNDQEKKVYTWSGLVRSNGQVVATSGGKVKFQEWASISWNVPADYEGDVEVYLVLNGGDSVTASGTLKCKIATATPTATATATATATSTSTATPTDEPTITPTPAPEYELCSAMAEEWILDHESGWHINPDNPQEEINIKYYIRLDSREGTVVCDNKQVTERRPLVTTTPVVFTSTVTPTPVHTPTATLVVTFTPTVPPSYVPPHLVIVKSALVPDGTGKILPNREDGRLVGISDPESCHREDDYERGITDGEGTWSQVVDGPGVYNVCDWGDAPGSRWSSYEDIPVYLPSDFNGDFNSLTVEILLKNKRNMNTVFAVEVNNRAGVLYLYDLRIPSGPSQTPEPKSVVQVNRLAAPAGPGGHDSYVQSSSEGFGFLFAAIGLVIALLICMLFNGPRRLLARAVFVVRNHSRQ